MKILTKYLAILIALLFVNEIQAQNPIDTDKGATPAIETVLANYQSLNTMTFEFQFETFFEKKVQDTYNGSMIIKGEKYFVEFQNQQIGCDAASIWNYQSETNEVSLSPFDADDDPIFHPTKLLTNWDKEYNPKFIREEKVEGITQQIIDLTPIARKSYFKVRLSLNKTKKEIISIQIFEKDGTVLSYTIKSFKSNIDIPDSQFVFQESKYPDVFINDMR